MKRLSIKGQIVLGVILTVLLSVVCSAITYFLIANAIFYSHTEESDVKGHLVEAAHFQLRSSIGTMSRFPTWLINSIIILLIFTPFIYIGLFTYLFAWRFSKGISSPIKTLVQAVRKIQAHDLDFQIDYQGNNEIGQLLNVFNEMRLDLKNSLMRQWSLEEERREMLLAISHDLRTPVTIIQGHAEMLMELQGPPESVNRYAEAILRNSSRIVRLLADFRTLTDIEGPQFVLSPIPVNLVDFFDEKLSEYEGMAIGASIELKHTITDQRNTIGKVSIDVDRLAQVIDNLMSNAFRYTPKGGFITWTVYVNEHELFVCLKDSGRGFNPHELHKVFRKFYRGDASRSKVSGHAGLGLYIVKELVERQSGRISAYNDSVGGGAVVELQLPIASITEN